MKKEELKKSFCASQMIRILSCDAGKTLECHPRALTRHGSVHTTSHLEPSGPSIKFVATWYACDCRGSVSWVFILLRGHLLQTVLPMQNARISCLMNTVQHQMGWLCNVQTPKILRTTWQFFMKLLRRNLLGWESGNWVMALGSCWQLAAVDISPSSRDLTGSTGSTGSMAGRAATPLVLWAGGRDGREPVENQLGDSSNFSNLPFGPAIDSLHEVNRKDGTTGQGLRSLRTLNYIILIFSIQGPTLQVSPTSSGQPVNPSKPHILRQRNVKMPSQLCRRKQGFWPIWPWRLVHLDVLDPLDVFACLCLFFTTGIHWIILWRKFYVLHSDFHIR